MARPPRAPLHRPAGEGARLVARRLLRACDAAAARLGRGEDGEALHDFRVLLRRLRSTLRAYRRWLGEAPGRKGERRLRRLARDTNAARDAEVQLALLARLREGVPARQGAALDAMAARLQALVPGGPLDPALLRRWRRLGRRLAAALAPATGAPGAPPFSRALARAAVRAAERLCARLAEVTGPADVAGIHRARIAGKRLRYLLEPLRGDPRADAGDLVRELKALQDVAGALHDGHVLAAALEEALGEARRPADRAGLGAVARRLTRERDRLHAQLARDHGPRGAAALAGAVERLAEALREGPARRRPARAASARRRRRPAARRGSPRSAPG